MNILKYIPKTAVFQASRAALKLQKSSPTTLFVAGGVGVIATAVLASRATLKAADELEKFQTPDFKNGWDPAEASNKDKVALAGKFAKIYAPTVVVGGLTIGALTGSHRILSARNTSLAAAYTAINDAYEKYQARVVEELGEEKAKELKDDVETRTFKIDGKDVKYQVAGKGAASIYAKFFDEYCGPWQKSAEANLVFLRCQQEYLTQKLHARGHVFLNEVYDALGIPRTTAGALVGWVSKNGGDGYIDFGLYNEDNPSTRAFINGAERSVRLDFNVDGPIYDLID